MTLRTEAWLEIVRQEYLAGFVPEGGGAVKFVVADAAGRSEVRDRLRETAERSSLQFAFVDAAMTKVHMIDKLFHEVARQVDWGALARAFLARVLAEGGYSLPAQPGPLTLAAIAELNQLPQRSLHVKIEALLWERLFRDYAMSQEFRLAMVRLCRAQLDPDDEPAVTQAVGEWLRGELRRISALKRALIFQKIARHNARHMLFSLAHWLRLAGRRGLLLVVDISRCTVVARLSERDGTVYYSTPATLDAYEVLRQLVDGVDDLESCFVSVLAGVDFLTDERRGVRRYDALYLRVADDVRDRYQPNPLAALVRLGSDGQGDPSWTSGGAS